MKKSAAAFLFSCLLVLGRGAAMAEELQLTYNVKIAQVLEKNDGKKEEKEFQHRITVGLGNGYIYFTDPEGAKIYDLKKERIIYVDDPGQTLSEVSLFSDVGFRFVQLRNRLYSRDAILRAAEKSKKPRPVTEAIFDLETFFGIAAPGSTVSGITETSSGGKVVYGSAQGTAVECRFSDQTMTPEQRMLWEKYLIYGCNIHPLIRRKMISLDRVPEFLRYAYRNAEKTMTVEQTLVKASLGPPDSYSLPSGYRKLYGPPGDALDMILGAVREERSPVKRLANEDFGKIVDDLASGGNYFDAALAALEYSIQTGDELPPKMKAAVDLSRTKDERANAFFKNLEPKDKRSAEKSGKVFEKIKRKGLTRGYIIDIMIADDKAMAGDSKGAKELFLKVLKINPYLAGVYRDLGDLLSRSYYVISAWQCWDTVRFLYPEHKALKQINDYEAWLRKNFPDFFLPKNAEASPVATAP